jgi:hypothetical protein
VWLVGSVVDCAVDSVGPVSRGDVESLSRSGPEVRLAVRREGRCAVTATPSRTRHHARSSLGRAPPRLVGTCRLSGVRLADHEGRMPALPCWLTTRPGPPGTSHTLQPVVRKLPAFRPSMQAATQVIRARCVVWPGQRGTVDAVHPTGSPGQGGFDPARCGLDHFLVPVGSSTPTVVRLVAGRLRPVTQRHYQRVTAFA